MYLKEKLNRSRRDFTAIYACQNCGYEKTDRGYDDEYFHTTVIPKNGLRQKRNRGGRLTCVALVHQSRRTSSFKNNPPRGNL